MLSLGRAFRLSTEGVGILNEIEGPACFENRGIFANPSNLNRRCNKNVIVPSDSGASP